MLAGSIPSSLPADIYERILERLSGKKIRAVVDATKDLLLNVLKYRPFLIKPNNFELGEIFGVEMKSTEDIVKYAGKILMFDNSRDAFGIAEYLLGYDVNTTDETELQACAAKLAEQKPVVQQYVMDQIFDAMENEEAWIAPYYAGDYLTMVEENPDLAFYRPTTQGYNMFIDAMCIPTCCQEKEAAEAFINFLCSPEISSANMEFLGYSVPSTAAKELMDPEVAGSEVAYPDADTLTTGTSFNFLPEETSRYMESLFMEVRNG